MVAKVIVRISGGIGNQLFSYSAIRRLSIVNETELVIDNITGFTLDHQYKRKYQLDHFHIPCRKATLAEQMEPLSRMRRMFKRKLNLLRPFVKRTYIQQEGLDFDPRLLSIKPQGTTYVEGYWQSEEYFKDVASIIRQELQIKPPIDAINLEMAEKIRCCNAVAIHVRFFDQPQIYGLNNAPVDYYTRAVALMESLVHSAHYIIFSDLPDAARARIPLPDARVTVVTHNQGDELAYADLWLMTQCKHFIIANSTFSWWGAWLSKSKDKIVIAPGNIINAEVMKWGFKGLLPNNWVKL